MISFKDLSLAQIQHKTIVIGITNDKKDRPPFCISCDDRTSDEISFTIYGIHILIFAIYMILFFVDIHHLVLNEALIIRDLDILNLLVSFFSFILLSIFLIVCMREYNEIITKLLAYAPLTGTEIDGMMIRTKVYMNSLKNNLFINFCVILMSEFLLLVYIGTSVGKQYRESFYVLLVLFAISVPFIFIRTIIVIYFEMYSFFVDPKSSLYHSLQNLLTFTLILLFFYLINLCTAIGFSFAGNYLFE